MMIELLGDESGPRHPAESLVEILEDKALADRLTSLDKAPSLHGGESG
jgi:hypothetical protein